MITVPAIALHALCAAFWLGALWPLLIAVRRLPAGQAAAVLETFSRYALAVVAIAVFPWSRATLRSSGIASRGIRRRNAVLPSGWFIAEAALHADPAAKRGRRHLRPPRRSRRTPAPADHRSPQSTK
jgi:hypothetical protein